MSLAAKIVIPIVIVGALVWLYMAKYPSMVAQTQLPQQQTAPRDAVPQQPAAQVISDSQLEADLGGIDADMKTASDASADAQTFNDTPVSQTE